MHTREMPSPSSDTSSGPDTVTLDDNSNDPTFPYGFGAQQPIVPPSLINLNLPPNLFITSSTIAVLQANPTQHDYNYRPQSPEQSEPSHISTPPMNVSAIDGWKFHIPQQMTTTSIRRTSQDGYAGTLPWTKPLIRKANPDEIICRPVHPRYHHLARRSGGLRCKFLFQNK